MHRVLAAVPIAFVVGVALACNGAVRFDEQSQNEEAGGGDSGAANHDVCQRDDDCTIAGLRCDVTSGRCVACLTDDDCGTPRARCSAALHVCVACLSDGDCGQKQRCETVTAICLDTCIDDGPPCPTAGFSCNEFALTCVECRSNSNCAGNPRGSRCDPNNRRCVACTGSADCPDERPRCDRRVGACVGCVTSAECAMGEACDPSTARCVALP